MKAIWKDTVIAESDDTVMVEGNHYFPEASLKNPTAIDVKSLSRMLARWPGLFIQALTTFSGVREPAARFSPAILKAILLSEKTVLHFVLFGRVWLKSVLL